MSPYSYPHSIDDGAGERLTFLRRVAGRGGDRLEVENVVAPGAGPVMHVHHYQEEVLTVQQGRIGYQRPGGAPQFAGPGDTVAFKPGDAHRFWNAGKEDLVCTGHIAPADNIEYFLGAIFESRKQNGGSGPHPLDAAFLARRYRSEFALTADPGGRPACGVSRPGSRRQAARAICEVRRRAGAGPPLTVRCPRLGELLTVRIVSRRQDRHATSTQRGRA